MLIEHLYIDMFESVTLYVITTSDDASSVL